jgi:dihydrofolate reductase
MGKIAAHEFMSIDGVYENPAWTAEYGWTPEMTESIGGLMQGSKAILLGRKTYEMFAPAWSGRTAEEDPGAPFMNESPKYVVGSTIDNVEWNNSRLLGDYDADRIRALKDEVDGTIYMSGSGTLVRALLRDGLLDELHLLVYPVALGSGEKLFAEGESSKLTLVGAEPYSNGVVHLTYGPAA